MDQGQYIEVSGLANAAYLREVVLPRCERRFAEEQELRAMRAVNTSPAGRVALVWIGRRLAAAGERLRSLGDQTTRQEA